MTNQPNYDVYTLDEQYQWVIHESTVSLEEAHVSMAELENQGRTAELSLTLLRRKDND